MSAVESIVRDFFETFRPPAKLTLSEWSDAKAYLSAESSAEPGRWKTIAYQREPMDACTDPNIETVVFMKSARVGFTKMLNNLIGYHIDQDPCSMLLVQPTLEDAEGYSKEEIAPMLRDTPCLQGRVSDAKAKDSQNTILAKQYPGGMLTLVGSNSPRGFRRVSRRVVMFDEVDGYPASAGTEGDPIKLGIRRTEYFWNRKIVAGSTPTVKDLSRIERMFETSDQRRYFVPCPHCDAPQYFKFPNLKWPDGEPHLAYFVCEKNGCVIEHSSKRWMIEEADRRKLAGSKEFGWQPTAPGNGKTAGFHIWAAYSYSPNATWGNLAEEFLEAKNDIESLKTFVNTALGETWADDFSARIGADGLKARVETWDPNVVPAGALVLTAGVDVQDNRFAVTIEGWGRGEERWTLEHMEIFGDPSQPEIWKQLDSVLFRTYRHELGADVKIKVAAIDSGGHHTHEVYQYARARRDKAPGTFVIAVKGASQKGKQAIGKPTKQDINYKGQVLKGSAELYPVGTDTIKSAIFGRLKLAKPGPNYQHFHAALTDDYFAQFTAEKQVTRYVNNFPIREWVKIKPGIRNEALDCSVYSFAAMQYLYTRFHRARIWDQLSARLNIKPPAEAQGEPVKSEEVPLGPEQSPEVKLKTDPPARRINPNRRSGGFVTNY